MSCSAGNCATPKKVRLPSISVHELAGFLLVLGLLTLNVFLSSRLAINLTVAVILILLAAYVAAPYASRAAALVPASAGVVGSQLPYMPTRISMSHLVAAPPPVPVVDTSPPLTEDTFLAGHNPAFVDVNKLQWERQLTPVDPARGYGDDANRSLSKRYTEATRRIGEQIASTLRPDPWVVFDGDDDEDENQLPVQIQQMDFVPAAHHGPAQLTELHRMALPRQMDHQAALHVSD